jgi:PPM family protein phosphatase
MDEVTENGEFELNISVGNTIKLADFQVQIESSICTISDINYFLVHFHSLAVADEDVIGQQGLLRVGSVDGALHRELEIRDKLGDYKMLSKLVLSLESAAVFVSSQAISSTDEWDELEMNLDFAEIPSKLLCLVKFNSSSTESDLVGKSQSEISDLLEEEYYPEDDVFYQSSGKKLLLLSEFPAPGFTLADWLQRSPHPPEEALSI